MGLSVNTYKSVNIFTNKVVLNINVHGARRYALKKRVLKRWIYSHGYAMNLRKETVTGLFIIISTVRYRVRPINENSFSKC